MIHSIHYAAFLIQLRGTIHTIHIMLLIPLFSSSIQGSSIIMSWAFFYLIYCLIIAFVVVTVLSLGKKRGSRSFSTAESSASFIFFSTLFLCFRVFERQFIIIQSLPMKTERERERERRGTLLRTATIKNMNQLLISSCEVLVRLIYVKTMKQGKYKRFIFFSFFVFMNRICLV